MSEELRKRVSEIFARHRSVRHFLKRPLEPRDLEVILAAARRASTDASAQMYAFLRITDAALRERMAVLAGDQQHIRDAAEYYVVCVDVHRLRRLVEHRGGVAGLGSRIALIYGTLDAGLAAENLAVAAEALGYGVCFIGGVQDALDDIARALHLPRGVMPVCGLCIGVPAPERYPPEPRPRLPLSAVVHENRYRDYGEQELAACYEAMSKSGKKKRRDWYEVLGEYFAAGGIMSRREAVIARAWIQQGLEPEEENKK
jgi:FMN reductase (NADPH)